MRTTYRNNPRKSLRGYALPKMDFHFRKHRARHLRLRRLKKHQRCTQPQSTLDTVIGATCNDACPAGQAVSIVEHDPNAVVIDMDSANSSPSHYRCASRSGAAAHQFVEEHSIHDNGFNTRWCIGEILTRGREEPCAVQFIQDRFCGQIKFSKSIDGQYSGAVYRPSNELMFFKHHDIEAAAS